MKLTVFNCSPKTGANNTQLLIDSLTDGLRAAGTQASEVHKLNRLDSVQQAVALFDAADAVLIAMPLYSYAMPGGVMELFEALEPLKGKCGGKKLGFMIQYGFREAIHARPLEKYLERLAAALGCDYMGTIVKGGCDALSRNPRQAFKAIYEGMEGIGRTLARLERFDPAELNAYAQPETSKPQTIWVMKIVMWLINRFYWGSILKNNGVTIAQSFTRPYAE